MRFLDVSALSALAVAVTAAPLRGSLPARHVVHEKRAHIPHHFTKRDRLHRDAVLPVRIGLAQTNLHRGYDMLMDVSDPDSPNFGKHWSNKEIADFFAPSQDSFQQVAQWLHTAGIHAPVPSTNLGWVEFEATAEEVEALLHTEYHLYDSEHLGGASHVACTEYSIPEHLRDHIDIITPTVHFDARPQGPKYERKLRRAAAKRSLEMTKRQLSGGPAPGPIITNITAAVEGLTTCDAVITPQCLRALYSIPHGVLDLTTYGITEYAPETYLQEDLDLFWATPVTNDAQVPVGTAPKIDKVDGGYLEPITGASFDVNGEADLDLEYAMDLVYPQVVTLYQVGDNGTNAANISFGNFLDALDKSYCTYDGGDDYSVDEKFPDPGGYMKKHMCGTYKAPAVLSTSYGYNEHDLTPAYEARQCYEYMKLGLAGTSFLFSSGDNGVAGNLGQCIAANGSYNDGTSGRFNPAFPSVCPYVTSVGATQIPVGGSVTQPETACETVIYSGGGFSDNFALPAYQAPAVNKYNKNNPNNYTAAQYNKSGKARGFPDVAANGANYVVALDATFQLVYGTSASSPTFASIIALLNNLRAAKGKASLGFLNPTFYKHPTLFNDITSGGNQGCGTPGFNATKGWDPVTGLGTPNFTKMAKVLTLL